MRFRLLARYLLLLVALVTVPSDAVADDTKLNESCDLSRFGYLDKETFLAFDQELRAALDTEDTVALSLLVDFPLQVNGTSGGSIAIVGPSTLQARFREAFPEAVRAAVANQKVDEIFCNWTGLMYGNGLVWVSEIGHRYAVRSINIPPPSTGRRSDPDQIARVCDAEKHRFVVKNGGQVLGWTKPRSLQIEPDIDAVASTRYEGTGLCAHAVWTFDFEETTFTLSGLGCSSDADPPPDHANGSLVFVDPDGKTVHSWCY